MLAAAVISGVFRCGSVRTMPENVVIIRHYFNDGNAENIGNLEKDDKISLKNTERPAILGKYV